MLFVNKPSRGLILAYQTLLDHVSVRYHLNPRYQLGENTKTAKSSLCGFHFKSLTDVVLLAGLEFTFICLFFCLFFSYFHFALHPASGNPQNIFFDMSNGSNKVLFNCNLGFFKNRKNTDWYDLLLYVLKNATNNIKWGGREEINEYF